MKQHGTVALCDADGETVANLDVQSDGGCAVVFIRNEGERALSVMVTMTAGELTKLRALLGKARRALPPEGG